MRAKAWVVGTLLVAGLCVTAVAGSISGSWFTTATFVQFQPLELSAFRSDLVMDYATCGWTLGAIASFARNSFNMLAFDVAGEVGAFDIYGAAEFDPALCLPLASTFLRYAVASIAVSIAGVNAYAVPVLSSVFWDPPPGPSHWASDQFGTGLLVGGWGSVGRCFIWLQARFNIAEETNFLIFHEGYDALLGRIGPHALCPLYCRGSWDIYSIEPQQTGCGLCWSGVNVVLQAPFACLENLTAAIDFDCDEGFNYVAFLVEHVCLGLSWLELGYLEVNFGVTAKELDWAFDLIVGDCLCFTPYLALQQQGTAVSGIELAAITVDYDMGQGVRFKAGHRFTQGTWYDFLDWYRYEWFGFTRWGEVGSSFSDPYFTNCDWEEESEEYIALEIDGDTCCGGAFNAWVYNWFDSDQAGGFMDWANAVIGLDVGIGFNTTLMIQSRLSSNRISLLQIWAEVLF